jgi:hypothetical protein
VLLRQVGLPLLAVAALVLGAALHVVEAAAVEVLLGGMSHLEHPWRIRTLRG